jgi:hypothetical protein
MEEKFQKTNRPHGLKLDRRRRRISFINMSYIKVPWLRHLQAAIIRYL